MLEGAVAEAVEGPEHRVRDGNRGEDGGGEPRRVAGGGGGGRRGQAQGEKRDGHGGDDDAAVLCDENAAHGRAGPRAVRRACHELAGKPAGGAVGGKIEHGGDADGGQSEEEGEPTIGGDKCPVGQHRGTESGKNCGHHCAKGQAVVHAPRYTVYKEHCKDPGQSGRPASEEEYIFRVVALLNRKTSYE